MSCTCIQLPTIPLIHTISVLYTIPILPGIPVLLTIPILPIIPVLSTIPVVPANGSNTSFTYDTGIILTTPVLLTNK